MSLYKYINSFWSQTHFHVVISWMFLRHSFLFFPDKLTEEYNKIYWSFFPMANYNFKRVIETKIRVSKILKGFNQIVLMVVCGFMFQKYYLIENIGSLLNIAKSRLCTEHYSVVSRMWVQILCFFIHAHIWFLN